MAEEAIRDGSAPGLGALAILHLYALNQAEIERDAAKAAERIVAGERDALVRCLIRVVNGAGIGFDTLPEDVSRILARFEPCSSCGVTLDLHAGGDVCAACAGERSS